MEILIVGFAVLIGLIGLFHAYASGWFCQYHYRVPFIGIEFPYLFGNITRKNNPALQIADFYNKYKQHAVIGIRMFHKPALIINDLKLVELVLVKKFNYFHNRGLFYNEKDPLSAILGTIDHDQWKPLRQQLHPAFKPMMIRRLFPQMQDLFFELVRNLYELVGDEGDKIVEIISTISRFTTDAIGTIAFGNNCTESTTRLRAMVDKSKQPYLTFPYNLITVAFPKFARRIGMRKHSKEVSDYFVNYVKEIVQSRAQNLVRTDDFMQYMIDAGLGIPRIAAIAYDLLSAGFADCTSTLVYCLFELAVDQRIQSKARDEIQQILENEAFSYESLQKMSYCNQIIKEAERKYPVAGIATRIATQDFPVPDTQIVIKRGTKVFVPIYGIHHDANYYPDPEVFNPDRFTNKVKIERPEFLPFGKGKRQCIGYRFAEMLIGIELVSLLRQFEFSTCSETRIPIQFNEAKYTLHPKDGVKLKIRRI